MAYMDQAKKAKIAAAVKEVMPAGWKYTLAVRHHSTIICTITQAPIDLLRAFKATDYFDPEMATELEVNKYHYRDRVDDPAVANAFGAILAALDTDNHDRSDSMTDYFDVGHYVELRIGRWDKPFVTRG